VKSDEKLVERVFAMRASKILRRAMIRVDEL
jgi:hypothetical protein